MELENVKIDCLGNPDLVVAAHDAMVAAGYKPLKVHPAIHPTISGGACYLLGSVEGEKYRISWATYPQISYDVFQKHGAKELDSLKILQQYRALKHSDH